MNQDKTGGPAFPRTPFDVNDYTGDGAEGMTLRDYFAAKAMQGLVTGGSTCPPEIVGAAYLIADAMLKERK